MSFDTVLIANRGEIAVRIIAACQALDLKTVAVYSEADRNAKYVSHADSAVYIGPSEAALSYLDKDALIKAARQSEAGAIHPGYGFLAENEEFASACCDAGLVFIGPKPDVIGKMGSKIDAKTIAAAAGVPVVPGYHGDDQSDDVLTEAAAEIGVPLMIKASAGGGGRGMRLVDNLDHFQEQLSMARQEADAVFGDPAVLLERYVGQARHVEVQVLCDEQGNCLHLFDRDCSLQRHHQKIIEEAPAPNLPDAVREEMYQASLSLCREIGYTGAGTVEFMYEPAREAVYFLEMNTRLQVEHPVTEKITGIDLVAWQLKIALGEPLPMTQDDIHISGCAIEARVAAENPAENYRPETGRITLYEEPDGEGIRVDSGVVSDGYVSHYYDSMIAKVIASADNRVAAIRRLGKALSRYRIAGPVTNIPFLRDILELPDFKDVLHHTGTLESAFDEGWSSPETPEQDLKLAALAAFLITASDKDNSPWRSVGGWRVTELSGRTGSSYLSVQDESGDLTVMRIEGRQEEYRVTADGDDAKSLVARNAVLRDGTMTGEIDGLRFTADVRRAGKAVFFQLMGRQTVITPLTPEQRYLGRLEESGAGGNRLHAPMPGLITDILVEKGQVVEAGETLIVFEAMKLMQKLTSPSSGTVQDIHYEVGDTPEKDALLLSLETE